MTCCDFVKNAKHKITIQQRTLSADSYGGFSTTWNTFKVVYAWVKPVRSNKIFENEQLQGRTDYNIIIRYIADLSSAREGTVYRLLLDTRVHDIIGIKNFDSDLKNYGSSFQELATIENKGQVD